MNRKMRKTAESAEPRQTKGLSGFEEFEGSNRSTQVETDLYAPEKYLVTKEYGIPSVLLNFELNFDRMLEEFFSKANPDEFNGSFMDATLKCLEAEALASLKLQRHEHLYSEIPFVLAAWKRGKTDYTLMRTRIAEELSEVEAEIRRYLQILHKGTSLE